MVVTRQTRPRLPSGAHSAPSGPVVMSAGTAYSASGYSLTLDCASAVEGIATASAATVAASRATGLREGCMQDL